MTEREEALRLWKQARETGPRVPQFDDDVQSNLHLSVNQAIELIRLARAHPQGGPVAWPHMPAWISMTQLTEEKFRELIRWRDACCDAYCQNLTRSPPAQAVQEIEQLRYLLKRAGYVIETETKRGNCGLVQEIRKATARIKL